MLIIDSKIIKIIIAALVVLWCGKIFAQTRSRIDLDDMMIKGELHNDDRINILARQKNELKNFVKFRTSYREEMLQELPVLQPKHKF